MISIIQEQKTSLIDWISIISVQLGTTVMIREEDDGNSNNNGEIITIIPPSKSHNLGSSLIGYCSK